MGKKKKPKRPRRRNATFVAARNRKAGPMRHRGGRRPGTRTQARIRAMHDGW